MRQFNQRHNLLSKVLLITLLVMLSACQPPIKQPVDYADVFIGTSNSRWMLGPYATMPFGMVQLGPDNQGSGWMDGYEYAINSVMGFSHIHAWTMGGLRMMPSTIDLVTRDRPTDAPYRGAQAGYHSRILKDSEKASPGYYEVFLYDHEVLAKMTVTKRCGFQEYTFPEREESRILIDLQFPSEYNFSVEDAWISKVSSTEIQGFAKCQVGDWNDYTLFFVVRFDTPSTGMHGWNNRELCENCDSIAGQGDIGVYLTFKTAKNETIKMQSGISLVSIDQARLNLTSEMDPFGWDFEKAAANARTVWNNLLGKIEIKGGSEKDKIRFYTNFYRAYSAKQTWNDVNGLYRDPCENIREVKKGGEIYGGDAFWNSFWNLNTLWTLVTPSIADNYVTTELELFKNTGWTSKGPTGVEYSGIMVGNHETALMVSAYQKGIRDDGDQIYEAILKNVTITRGGETCNGYPGNDELDIYTKYGYIPYEMGMTSNLLDYAFDDWCVAQMALALGHNDIYTILTERSKSYLNIYHPDYKYFVPKDSTGNWMEGFDEFSNFSFIEGNSWQYQWYVPHDIPAMVDLLGRDLFNSRLESGFEKSAKWKYAAHAFDRTEGQRAEFYVNHGNEVNMQAAWLFNYSGKPWLTQKYTHAIMDAYYGDIPFHGWEGDEDEGQMGAWYVISALGLFEMDGACTRDPVLTISSPKFKKISIHLDSRYYPGEKLVIEAKHLDDENIYIQSATLNGKRLSEPFVRFKDIVGGGKIVYQMGKRPNPACFQDSSDQSSSFQ